MFPTSIDVSVGFELYTDDFSNVTSQNQKSYPTKSQLSARDWNETKVIDRLSIMLDDQEEKKRFFSCSAKFNRIQIRLLKSSYPDPTLKKSVSGFDAIFEYTNI